MLAFLVADHCIGDVLEELHKILRWICHIVIVLTRDGKECLGSCGRLDDHLPLVFGLPQTILPGHLIGPANDALFAPLMVLPQII